MPDLLGTTTGANRRSPGMLALRSSEITAVIVVLNEPLLTSCPFLQLQILHWHSTSKDCRME